VAAPGKLDAKLGEFWVENPWDIIQQGYNLSAYERKRTYWNVPGKVGGRDFVDISFLTGTDNDGDGRAVIAGDFRNNGQLDLLVRQVGGGPVLLYENHFPKRHYLKVSLRGKPGPSAPTSNRLGIGARLIAEVKGQKIVREMNPINSYRSQMPNIVHFGLGEATTVDRLLIQWPSGLKQELMQLPADRHIVVSEDRMGSSAVETVVPGKVIEP
jgi:hypothetical protein